MGEQRICYFIPLEVTFICQETGPTILPSYGGTKVQSVSLRNHGREDVLRLP